MRKHIFSLSFSRNNTCPVLFIAHHIIQRKILHVINFQRPFWLLATSYSWELLMCLTPLSLKHASAMMIHLWRYMKQTRWYSSTLLPTILRLDGYTTALWWLIKRVTVVISCNLNNSLGDTYWSWSLYRFCSKYSYWTDKKNGRVLDSETDFKNSYLDMGLP